jgi:hypothetical protein
VKPVESSSVSVVGLAYFLVWTIFMILIASDQAFLLMLISVCLGACFVWAFWEIEEARKRRQPGGLTHVRRRR